MKRLYFPQYTKYIGMPLYKFGRKKGFSKLCSIGLADVPGSLVVGAFVSGIGFLSSPENIFNNLITGLNIALFHEAIMTAYFYNLHKRYSKSRKNKLQGLEASITEENQGEGK